MCRGMMQTGLLGNSVDEETHVQNPIQTATLSGKLNGPLGRTAYKQTKGLVYFS